MEATEQIFTEYLGSEPPEMRNPKSSMLSLTGASSRFFAEGYQSPKDRIANMFGKTFKNYSNLKNSRGTRIHILFNLQEERSLLQIYKFSPIFSNLLETNASTEEIP